MSNSEPLPLGRIEDLHKELEELRKKFASSEKEVKELRCSRNVWKEAAHDGLATIEKATATIKDLTDNQNRRNLFCREFQKAVGGDLESLQRISIMLFQLSK